MKNTVKTIIISCITILLLVGITLFIMYKNYENKNYNEPKDNSKINIENSNENETNKITLHLFHGSTCPACLSAIEKMQKDLTKYNYLEIKTYEVWSNPDNSKLMQKVAEKLGVEAKYIPFIIIGNYSTTGYNEETITNKITEYNNSNNYQDIVSEVIKENSDLNPISENLK